jgi:hypothetical protein
VTAGSKVPFTAANLVNTAPGTRISLTSTGVLTINDTGYYQVTFGITASSGVCAFTLESSNFATGTQYVAQAGFTPMQTTPRGMYTQTVVILLTASPSTLSLVNTGATVTLQDIGGGVGPEAFITIFKLK